MQFDGDLVLYEASVNGSVATVTNLSSNYQAIGVRFCVICRVKCVEPPSMTDRCVIHPKEC